MSKAKAIWLRLRLGVEGQGEKMKKERSSMDRNIASVTEAFARLGYRSYLGRP